MALAAGCSDAPRAGAQRVEQPTKAATTGLEELAALGYGGYDESPLETLTPLAEPSPHAPDGGPLLLTDERNRVDLMARDGRSLWSLEVTGRNAVELAEPLPGGDIATLSVDEGVDVFDAQGLRVARWDLDSHHDLAAEPDGRLLIADHTEHPYRGRRVRFDRIVRVDPRRPQVQPEVVWDSFHARAQLVRLAGPSVLDREPESAKRPAGHKIYDRFHLNSIQVLPNSKLGQRDPRFAPGNLLLCLRNTDLILVLRPGDGEITWSFGTREFDFPHHPTLLPSGAILVFDNGFHRESSRLVELRPGPGDATEVTWTWQASDPTSFHTSTRGAAERLANGHTLVTDSESGRLFELDAAGRLAWQWLRPLEPQGRRRRIYRATRPSDAWVASLLKR